MHYTNKESALPEGAFTATEYAKHAGITPVAAYARLQRFADRGIVRKYTGMLTDAGGRYIEGLYFIFPEDDRTGKEGVVTPEEIPVG
jgi:predicted transcriptional regulator